MLPNVLLSKNRTQKYRKQNYLFYCTINVHFAQGNLVPNSSFETYSTCPTGYSQLPLATPWYAPTNNDAELFNSCSSPSSAYVSVPSNDGMFGFQYASSGNGYAGLWALNGSNYREYIQVQLDISLQANNCYAISYFINLTNWVKYAVNNIGLHLSDTAILSTATGYILNVIPQILKYKNPIINDTVNWIPVSGIYVATGGEQFITIGNFFDDANTDTFATNNGTYPGAYYYIDDVSVIALDSSFSLWQYNDTSVYIGDSVFIGQEVTGLNCTWYDTLGNVLADSVPGIYVSPTATTNYIVVENLCGNIRTDTITVTINYVGIEEEGALQKIILYPNPAPGGITIAGFEKNISIVEFRLLDLNGREIFNKNVSVINGAAQLEVEVTNGTYLLYITLPETKERIVKRVVIQK